MDLDRHNFSHRLTSQLFFSPGACDIEPCAQPRNLAIIVEAVTVGGERIRRVVGIDPAGTMGKPFEIKILPASD
jgi:hypothetical protein